ncbi:PepSY domain-containing protein [Stappia taiwanensis]|uniref:PepSY domain-containing protein n=1 Tax=Stappia taiwanensis TaxID=992267 RepID=A0A838XPC9_9HYPH|nr:PepSY domain-containing protein [Stappia taiwanensis]MBA4613109.1 PepSY domain-containing protein [Stappia taiwanensis]GGF01128.1 hypothetical protein GCM10007285_30940 [Stappia taiwanensis]
MKKSAMIAALLAALVMAGGVRADDDDCQVPMADWKPRAAVEAMAKAKGWTVRRIKTDDGCYKLKGRDADGRKMKAKIDPATLAIVEIEYRDDDDHRRRDHDRDRKHKHKPAPTGAVSPPNNGLFNTTSPAQPVVK